MDNAKPKKVPEKDEGLIVAAAKAIGGVAGTMAHSMGVQVEASGPAPHRHRPKGKLQPKNKSRLPRRSKKAARKEGRL
ncbi:MAG TPA: hypothetical protein VG297_02495 [Bryobacteraceae bacterium]|nr:hypothetical protein [Bryobacteraceae bacterium]